MINTLLEVKQLAPADAPDTAREAEVRGSFAESAPEALGRFNDELETLESVAHNGWHAFELRMEPAYSPKGSAPVQLYREVQGLEDVRLRRRPLDGFTLQASGFHEFEDANSNYFPFPYTYPRKSGNVSTCYEQVLRLAVEELGRLDFLHPLASVMQRVRRNSLDPLITRCWDFESMPAALIKTAKMERAGSGELIEGACICYQPPTWAELEENPANYLTFRSVVAHEIGHQWWHLIRDHRPAALGNIDDSDKELLEQVVGLFSIFLILYRGYWHREPPSREQLLRAFDKLEFQTDWMKGRREQIADEVKALEFPTRTFRVDDAQIPDLKPEPVERLGELEILAIREAAREIASQARPIPFASAAAVLGQRKLDYYVSFELGEPIDFPSWTIEEVEATHLDTPAEVRSEWRHVHFKLPTPLPGEIELDLKKSLEVAREIAHLRLYGGHYGDGESALQRSVDVPSQCTATERDLARVLALALYAQDGIKTPRKMEPQVAKMLLHHDPSNLGYLDVDFDYYFQWCCVDPDCPEAQDRFLAEILEVGSDEAHFTMAGEDGGRLRGSLPVSSFVRAGFATEDLERGTEFKLFGVDGELVPFLAFEEDE